jgi:hypothetical protein
MPQQEEGQSWIFLPGDQASFLAIRLNFAISSTSSKAARPEIGEDAVRPCPR